MLAEGITLVAQAGMPSQVEVLLAPNSLGQWPMAGAWSGVGRPAVPLKVYDVWDSATFPPNTPFPGCIHGRSAGKAAAARGGARAL